MKIVKLFDGSEIKITDTQAVELKQALEENVKFIEIGEDLIRISAISSVRTDSGSTAV